ncbi:hypothetical protein SLS55_008602 [Diplodia seriata]|uniref:Class II aldolase/adducin N-terminal domain-containing protein n=1 Tax=Diplodia seriata TaxID=420778 RepID=A0A1S8BFL4_9PEZI|nr:hypothetical protein BK809_0003415 [Diplodia seriata]
MASNISLTDTLRLLITANHVLHYHSIVDAFGHISVRNPLDASTFYMSAMLAPAIVASPDDLVQYYVSNGSAVDPAAPEGYSERFIHSEVLRQYPSVGSVIHSHADELLPFTIVEGVEVQPAFHMAGFIGDAVPVFDIARYYTAADTNHNLLVSNPHLGAALASHFDLPAPSANESSTNATSPARTLVLMRGHGFTTVGVDILTAVYRAYYIAANARLQSAAMALGSAVAAIGGDQGNGGGGGGRVRYLSARERHDAGDTKHEWVVKAWGLWLKEVRTRAGGLYENALGWPVVR